MKRYIYSFILLFAICSYTPLTAQKDNDRQAHKSERIQKFIAERQAFLSKESGMTAEEAKAFFPLYDEMNHKRFLINREVRKKIREIVNEGKKVTDAEYLKLVDDLEAIPQKEAEINKGYYAQFKKILSPEKLFKLKMAEDRFMKMTLNHGGPGTRPHGEKK